MREDPYKNQFFTKSEISDDSWGYVIWDKFDKIRVRKDTFFFFVSSIIFQAISHWC